MKIEKVQAPEPNDRNNMTDQFLALYEVVKQLRLKCPWDSVQSNESIAHLLIEECYETIEAIHNKDDKEFSKELGDLLLHIILHSVMAEERNAFDFNDVMERIREKLVFRHPHVFGDVEVSGEEEVVQNWEALKKKEGKKSALEGVPLALPALLRAERMQHKASKMGFDWDDKEDVWEKVEEELRELKHELKNGNPINKTNEFGDLLFSLVNAARFESIVPEEALQFTNEKFKRRFQYIEEIAANNGKDLKNMTLEEMDKLWDAAKSKGL